MSDIVNTELREAADRIRARLSSVSAEIIEIGIELLAIKEKLEHGQFTDWVLVELNMSHSTANNFMTLAKNKDRIGADANKFSPSALYNLVGSTTPPEALEIAKEVAKTQDKPVSKKQAKEIIQSLNPAVDLVSGSGFGVIPNGWWLSFEGMLGKCRRVDRGEVELDFPNDVLVKAPLSQVWHRPAIAGNQVIIWLRSARKMGATKTQKGIFDTYHGLIGKVEKIGVKDCSVTVSVDDFDPVIVFWDEVQLVENQKTVDASVFNPGDRIRRKSSSGFVWHGFDSQVTEFAYVSAVQLDPKFGDKHLLQISRNPDLAIEGFTSPESIDFAPEVEAIALEPKPVISDLNPAKAKTFKDKLSEICEAVSVDPIFLEFPNSQERQDFLEKESRGFVLLRTDIIEPRESVAFMGKAKAIAFIHEKGLILNLLYFGDLPEKFCQVCKEKLSGLPVFINSSEVLECLDF